MDKLGGFISKSDFNFTARTITDAYSQFVDFLDSVSYYTDASVSGSTEYLLIGLQKPIVSSRMAACALNPANCLQEDVANEL